MVSPSFGVYLLLDYPSRPVFLEALRSLRGCTDFYEIGLPSRRPKYDGPTIRRAHASLSHRDPGEPYNLPPISGVPAIAMGYLEDLGLEGLSRIAVEASKLGYSSILLPDLLFEYYHAADEYAKIMNDAGMRPSFFVSSKFPHKVMARLARYRPLLVYMGLQPSTGVELPISVERNVRLARSILGDEATLLVGFSIKKPETIEKLLEAGADAVVVGSAILEMIESKGIRGAVNYACTLYQAAHRR